MKPFAMISLALTWLSIFPADDSTIKWKKIAYKLFGVCFIFWNLMTMITSMAFFQNFASQNLKSSLGTIYQISGGWGGFCGIIFLILSRHTLSRLFAYLTEICEARK